MKKKTKQHTPQNDNSLVLGRNVQSRLHYLGWLLKPISPLQESQCQIEKCWRPISNRMLVSAWRAHSQSERECTLVWTQQYRAHTVIISALLDRLLTLIFASLSTCAKNTDPYSVSAVWYNPAQRGDLSPGSATCYLRDLTSDLTSLSFSSLICEREKELTQVP